MLESESPSTAGSSFDKVNSKRPSAFVRVAKRLSGEKTKARGIGSRLTLLTTMPRMVSLSSDVDCAADPAPVRQAPRRKKRTASENVRRRACRQGARRDKSCSLLFKGTAPRLPIVAQDRRNGQMRELWNENRPRAWRLPPGLVQKKRVMPSSRTTTLSFTPAAIASFSSSWSGSSMGSCDRRNVP